MRFWLFLFVATLQFSASLAHADLDQDIIDAISAGNFEQASNLLRTVTKKPDDSAIVYAVWLELYDHPDKTEQLKGILRQALRLGVNPTTKVEFDHGNPYGFELSAVEIILHEWEQKSKRALDNARAEEMARAARKVFDVLFQEKALDLNYQMLFAISKEETRRFSVVQWLIVREALPELRNYFMSKGELSGLRDDVGWNVAMTAAMAGDLATLKAIREKAGMQKAAQIFNFKSQHHFNPTVLHVAISGLHAGQTAERVIEVIDYLVENGADPSQRSKFHNLIDEVDFWIPRFPQLKDEYLKVRKFLVERSQYLKIMHESFKTCSMLLNGDENVEKPTRH